MHFIPSVQFSSPLLIVWVIHCCLDEGQADGRDSAQSEDDVSGGVNALHGQAASGVPEQVTNAVEAVEGEGVGNQELSSNLGSDGDGGDSGGDGSSIETETEHGEDSVADGTGVETYHRTIGRS